MRLFKREIILSDDRGEPFCVSMTRFGDGERLDKSERKAMSAWWRGHFALTLRGAWKGELLQMIGLAGFVAIFFGGHADGSMISWAAIVSALTIQHFGMQITLKHARRMAAQGLASIGRCGQCLYRLAGLAVEADGCVTCPECGSAWKAVGDDRT